MNYEEDDEAYFRELDEIRDREINIEIERRINAEHECDSIQSRIDSLLEEIDYLKEQQYQIMNDLRNY